MSGREEKKVRNSKLEYFLKRNLHPSVYNDIRWYEAVIVRTGNSLAYKQAVVTGQDVYLTETPPRTLNRLLTVSSLTHVALVHDLPEFLRGGVRDQTTHVTIRYRPERRASINATRERRGSLRATVSAAEPSTSSIDEVDEEDLIESRVSTPALARPTTVTHVLAQAAHDTASVCSDPNPSIHFTVSDMSRETDDASFFNSGERSKEWTPPNLSLRRNSANGLLPTQNGSTHRKLTTNFRLTSPRNSAKSPIRSRSPDMESAFDVRTVTPTIADLLTRVPGRQVTRSTTPDALPRSRMPRSLSALENYHRSSPLALDIPKRSKSVLDKPLQPQGQPPRRSQSMILNDVTDGNDEEREVHLYTLSTSTLLFHLLHSLWLSSSLMATHNPLQLRPIGQELSQERLLDHTFGQLRMELLAAANLEEQFGLLQELQQAATKYSTIRRLVWRNPDVVRTLRTYLQRYSKVSSTRGEGNLEEELQERQDELELLALTLETLASCLQGTQRCPFKMKVLRHNKCETLRNMIAEAMAVPEIPAVYKLTCDRWLLDFRELSSHAWENLPESELLKLVQEVTHTSTSCLYELLSSFTELTWVGTMQAEPREEVLPNLTTMFQHAPVEGWLSYSVPQLLVLLQPEREGYASGPDAALAHQYCTVLATLLHHSPRALQYCTTHYTEELRYYVHESVVSCRLQETCPIRTHTIKMVSTIAQLVKSKSSLRAR